MNTANRDITQTVGNTPLIQLKKLTDNNCADVFIKLEYFNPTGSYKDRMALAIVEEAEQRGDIQPGDTLIEYTGGSTGTSLAFACAVKGYQLKAISSDAFAKEKLQTIRLFGADIEIIKSDGGSITPQLFIDMEARVKALIEQEGYYWTQQFVNKDARKGYANIAEEVLLQLSKPIDVFCAAVGTAGMLTGVAPVLKAHNNQTKIVALEPASSAFLSKGIAGKHRVEGIATGKIPPLLEAGAYDEAMAVEEADARATAKALAKQEGIFAGTSSGLNITAAIQIAKQLGPGKTVVTVACDSGMKYLAGDLFE